MCFMKSSEIVEEIFRDHRSIRKYKSQEIEENVLNSILKSAARAASTGNMQLYSVVLTKDKERKDALSALHFRQSAIETAPVVLTFVADINRFSKWCEFREAGRAYDNFLWFLCSTIDTILMAENVVVAAESFGLGTCFLGTSLYTAKEISKLLKLPSGVVPITTLTLGYPAETPELTDRLSIDGFVHLEEYQDYDRAKIDEIFAEKEGLVQTKELLKENNLPNLAQIFTQKRYPLNDNIKISKEYIELLKEKGFLS